MFHGLSHHREAHLLNDPEHADKNLLDDRHDRDTVFDPDLRSLIDNPADRDAFDLDPLLSKSFRKGHLVFMRPEPHMGTDMFDLALVDHRPFGPDTDPLLGVSITAKGHLCWA